MNPDQYRNILHTITRASWFTTWQTIATITGAREYAVAIFRAADVPYFFVILLVLISGIVTILIF